MGKKKGYIDNLFVTINELDKTDWLKEYLKTHVDVSFQDVIDTNGIADTAKRFNLLEQRNRGVFSQKALREQVKTIKEGDNPATGTPGTVPDCLAIPSAANMVSMGETPIAVSDTPEVPASAEAAGKAHPQRPAATGRADLNVQAQKMRV
ncbi:MAG: hypothetical protein LBB98_13545, partial [Treponema sp.]|nr:hypothetical protein [Treponema sp.]